MMSILLNTISSGLSTLNSAFSVSTIIKTLQLLAVTSNYTLHKYSEDCQVTNGEVFDFIVVGGGTAGLVVANRLTEIPNWRVLLVEAGDDPNLFSVIPGLFSLFTHSPQDWDYYSEDDGVTSQHLNTHRVAYTKGKVLGGDSSINHLIYERGTFYDFVEWAKYNDGWDWKTVLKYYKKSEKMLDKQILAGPTSKYHNTKGLLSVKRQNVNSQFENIKDELLNAYDEIGVKKIVEINGPKPNGTSIAHLTITKGGARASTAQAYLLPIKYRKNLCIVKKALATKILINSRKIAKGIKVSINSGQEINLYAKNDVILSAGVFNSPQLLMLSGVGPKKDLETIGINVVEDLPVGTNLQDHVTVPIIHSGKQSLITTFETALSVIDIGTLPLPLVDGTFSLDEKMPNLQHISAMFGASSPLFLIILYLNFNYDLDFTTSHLLKYPDRELLLSLVVNGKPKSRGKVTLRSKNPRDGPKIYTNFFEDKADLKNMVAAIRKITTLQNTTYFQKVGGTFSRPPIPECDRQVFDSDEYWECYAKSLAGISFHPVGTCAMGIVTDNRQKVKGITNLRVIDASGFPTIPCGKTAAVTIMFAERAVEFIKEEYGYSS